MITEIKNVIFEKYQIRKSKKQKSVFIEYIKGICEENGINCTVEKKGVNRNIVMGASPEDCDMVMGAHYDTCANMIIPNFITPRNFLVYICYSVIVAEALLLVSGIIGIAARLISPELGFPIYFISVIAIIILMMAGPANKHTANDNTSGVVTILNTMLAMSGEQRSKVCFVLFDNEELGLLGSSAFCRMHRKAMKNKPLVNFDCVSDGDYLFAKLSHKDRKSEFGKKFTEVMEKSANKHGMIPKIGTSGFYPSDQANFKRGIGVAALNRSKLIGLYMNRIHTVRDTVFNDRNIECLTSAMLELTSDENTAKASDCGV